MLQALQVKLHLPGDRIKLHDVEPQLLSTFSFQQFIEIIRMMAPEVNCRRLKWTDIQGDLIALEDDRDLQAAMKYLVPLSESKQLLRVYAPEDTVIPQFDDPLISPPKPLQNAPTNRAQACDSTQPEVPEAQRPPPQVLVIVKSEPIDDDPAAGQPVQLATGTSLRTGGSRLSTSSSSSSATKGQQNLGAKQQSGSSGPVPTAALKLSANVVSVVNAFKNSRPKVPSSAANSAAAAKIGQASTTPLLGSVSSNSVPQESPRHAVSGKQPDTNSSGSNVSPAKSSRNDLRFSLPLPQFSSQRAEKRKSTPPSIAFPPLQAFIEASGSCALQRQANIRNGVMESDSDSSGRDEQALLERKRKAEQEQKRRRAKENALLRQFARSLDRKSPEQIAPEQPSEPLGFPDWLTVTQPRKSPYFPQVGDEVVYFWQGHLLYVREVIDQNLYAIDQRNLPYLKYTGSIKAEEICRVQEIKFVTKPHRLCSLKLARLNVCNSPKTASVFSFKYHDMPGVVDFIVLKQHYDRGVAQNWQPKDLFRTVIDGEVFSGRIVALGPFQADLPDSRFLAVEVTWSAEYVSASKDARLSCWDLEVYEKQDCSVGDLRQFALTDVGAGDWPPHGKAAETKRLLAGLDHIVQFAWAKGFCIPVNLADYPTYPTRVAYPCDLGTIRERLRNEFYRHTGAVAFDVKQIYANAQEFNKSRSAIIQYAKVLRNVLLTFIKESSCNDIDEICDIEVEKLPRSLILTPEFVAAEVAAYNSRKNSGAADADLIGIEGSSGLKRRRTEETSLQDASPPDAPVSAALVSSSGPSRALKDNGETAAAPKKQKLSAGIPSKPPHSVDSGVRRILASQARPSAELIMRNSPKTVVFPSIERATTVNATGPGVPRMKVELAEPQETDGPASASGGTVADSRFDEEYAKQLQAEFDAEVQIVFDAAAPARNRQLEDDEKLARQLAMEEEMHMDDHVSDDDNSDYNYDTVPAAATAVAPSSKTPNLTPTAFRKGFNGTSASTDGASTSSGVGSATPFRPGHAPGKADGGPSTSATPQSGAGGMNRGHPQNDRKSAKGGRPGNR